MLQNILEFEKQFNDKSIKMINYALNQVVRSFKCFVIKTENSNLEKISEIKKKKNESKTIIINKISKNDNIQQFVIIFDFSIIFVSNSDLSFLFNIINNSNESDIYSFNNEIRSYLPSSLQKNLYANENFNMKDYLCTIKNFSNNFEARQSNGKQFINIWEMILPSFSSYFINKSYKKLQNERININYIKTRKIELKNDNYIKLQILGQGSSSVVQLIYHIKLEELFVLKIFKCFDDRKFQRELKNYENIQHPLIPHFYGKTKIDYYDTLIIEYIQGRLLSEINDIQLDEFDEMSIIFQLMLIIEYLHFKKYIYRDLKPNNIIIDQNKNPVLIDFDRMVNINDEEINENTTKYFCNEYICPEIKNDNIKKYTFKEDVYSIGVLMNYIFYDRIKSTDKIAYILKLYRYKAYQINLLISECLNEDHKKRPNITILIDYFYNIFYEYAIIKSKIIRKIIRNNISFFPQWIHLDKFFQTKYQRFYNKSDINKYINFYSNQTNKIHFFNQYTYRLFYLPDEYITKFIDKFIFYLTKLSDEDNNSESQNYLGVLNFDGIFIQQNIQKGIQYLLLSAKQNNQEAQLNLGIIFYEGISVQKNINKALYYLTLSANQNNSEAQCKIGEIYFLGKYIQPDFNKALHYFLMSANQNYSHAQFYLGYMYKEGINVQQNLDKAINYLTLSANQDFALSQCLLGIIYIKIDISKAINYLTLAAEKDVEEAQSELGKIYYFGKYIKRDINKAIYYLTLAANKNNLYSIYILGKIYYEGKYIKRDIDKAIKYLTISAHFDNNMAQFLLGMIYYEEESFQNVNKSIQYLTLSAKKNNQFAQTYLGVIYYSGIYVQKDIDKAIYYLTLSANQNNFAAQCILGFIYYYGRYIKRDVNKGIKYLSQSANQNSYIVQFYLGKILYEGEYIQRDVNKAIYYLSLSAKNNYTVAQSYLGCAYYFGDYISKDIDKSIQYFLFAANKNDAKSQYYLGYIYCRDKSNKRNFDIGVQYFLKSAKNNYIDAYFPTGYFYHEGKFIERDIKKAIYYYKEASSFNDQYAKNNLGIIYKTGILNEIEPNLGLAIEYFKEAISKKNNFISMYNLSNIYIYTLYNEANLNKSIELLILSTLIKPLFQPSQYLLCLALIKKYDFNIEIIEKEIQKLSNKSKDLPQKLFNLIKQKALYNKYFYDQVYEFNNNLGFLYDNHYNCILSDNLYERTKDIHVIKQIDITTDFYNGFGNDL